MDFESWFQLLCKELEKTGKVQEISKVFAKLKTESSQFDFVSKLPELKKLCTSLAENLGKAKRRKCPELATKLRNVGNNAYQQRNSKEAIRFYNESVFNAPWGDASNSLALAYANRSAVLLDLKKYILCLRDIELAFANCYPESLQYKLYERQANCYVHLEDEGRALKSFQLALKSLAHSSLDPAKLKSYTKNISKKIDELEKKAAVPVKPYIVEELHDKILAERSKATGVGDRNNPRLPCASQKVAISYSEIMGRHLVATEDVKPGEILIQETPFCSIVLPEAAERYCHHCLHPVIAPVPCENCNEVGFCGNSCRDETLRSHHTIECGIVKFLSSANLGKNSILAFRTVSQMGFRNLLDFLESDTPPGDPVLLGCDLSGVYDSSRYATVYHLISNSAQRNVADLFRRTTMAVYMTEVLKRCHYFPVDCVAEDVTKVGAVLLRHVQNYPCNAHEISHFHFNAAQDSTPTQGSLTEIGAAAFGCLSLINHSCDPNVVRHCYGNVAVVRAIRTIRKGEEILDNYGYHYAVHPLVERRESLRKQYYFTCACVACLRQWPLYDKLESSLKPKERNNCTETMKMLQESSDLFHQSLNDFVSSQYASLDVKSYLTIFSKHLQILDEHVQKPCREINMAQEAMKHALSLIATVFA